MTKFAHIQLTHGGFSGLVTGGSDVGAHGPKVVSGRINELVRVCVGRRPGVCTIRYACKTKGPSSDLAGDYIRLDRVGGLPQLKVPAYFEYFDQSYT